MSPRRASALRGGDQSLRDHLIAAAEALMARRGTAGLTVRDIAREARVADGVLYNHFADKEDLLAQALHAHVSSVERSLGTPPARAGAGEVADNLRAYVEHGLRLHVAILPAFAGLLAQPKVLTRFAGLPNPMAGGRGLRAHLADYLRAERDLGRLAPDADPESAAVMIVGACHEMVLPNLLRGVPAEEIEIPPGFTDGLVATVMRGIGPA
ncbi:TetR/AcrR family transcriptional regulator [Actinoallomurus iriomotensis]|uniref:TetR family transcriptional regulator n=1 Tax=Actinoallomurus iriomotensis TaxID=478107 RepID=A0A9W6R9U4_9ACTN|nr:TetR/AcrR family transcriptional regulator [Actinoallomurus iriomotensis]GLY71898.1 TetR family transcriptional regulator [Actinoallomurus iriomotensis]